MPVVVAVVAVAVVVHVFSSIAILIINDGGIKRRIHNGNTFIANIALLTASTFTILSTETTITFFASPTVTLFMITSSSPTVTLFTTSTSTTIMTIT